MAAKHLLTDSIWLFNTNSQQFLDINFQKCHKTVFNMKIQSNLHKLYIYKNPGVTGEHLEDFICGLLAIQNVGSLLA